MLFGAQQFVIRHFSLGIYCRWQLAILILKKHKESIGFKFIQMF
jgi:hypothetical protein